MKYYYEVLWYNGNTEEEALHKGDYDTKTFASKQSALNYYEKHKNDANKFGWWVTKRYTDDGTVADDIIY